MWKIYAQAQRDNRIYKKKLIFLFLERENTRVFAANTKTRVKRNFLGFLLVRALGLGELSLHSPYRILNHRVSWSKEEIQKKGRIRFEDKGRDSRKG